MTHLETLQPTTGISGGRRSSPKFRETIAIAEDFSGLPEGVTHFDLLKLVKRAGREIGFTSKMIELLEYYILFTRPQDWEEGAQPIVYQSLYKTALHFSVGDRQIQKIEQALFDVGALTWNDSGNHKRYGVRAETGEIIYAYGVDLSPLAHLRPVLEKKMHEKQMRDVAWMETKRKISAYRARIRALLSEIVMDYPDDTRPLQVHYDEIALPIRAYMPLENLLEMSRQHESLLNEAQSLVERLSESGKVCELSQECSSTDATDSAHKYSTTNSLSNKLDTSSHSDISFQESVADRSETRGKDRAWGKVRQEEESGAKYPEVTFKQILNAASPRFLNKMPMEPRPMNEGDLVEAAYRLLPDLGIHKSAWGEACTNIGRLGAAMCVLIIDQKQDLPENRVRNPGGYLRAMVQRAKTSELNLHGSIFGLLKRGENNHAV
ncbi:MAG: hypothetical protein CO093_06495 [Alphaproteobacteria bacterium CG_4_9_14_3_um_filter_47_13]|nr:MAG: hypothetical protein CO093_06495 [Alphaproteobacteria bacterium CG_4_9_14_3_um_filter_47_13]